MDYMEHIQNTVDDAWDELHGAKHYAEVAGSMKGHDANATRMFSEMAKQELQHAENLEDAASKIASSSNDETIKKMWNWMWKRLEDKKAEIMAKINMIER